MKVYVSDDLIQKEGLAFFYEMQFNDFWCRNFGIQEDYGYYLSVSDMGDYYLSVDENDCSFNDIEDLEDKIELAYRSKFYSMKQVCEKAGINYQTYKQASSSNFKSFSDKKDKQLLETMEIL